MISTPAADPAAATARLRSLQRSVKILVSALAVFLLTGGATVSAKTPELNESQLQAKLSDPASGLQEFVSLIEQSMITGEMWPVEEKIDQQAILNRATDGVEVPGVQTMREIFADSTQQSWQSQGITRDFAGSNFRFLRVRTFKNRSGLLFRSAGENNTLNFFSFTIHQSGPRDYRITDIYTAGINEYTSETLRRTYLNLAASVLGEEGRRLTRDKGAFVDSLEEIAAISQKLKAGEYSQVLEACTALPPAVQNDRSVMLIRLEAAEHYSVTSRAEALEAWLKVFPDEMELPLKLADHYLTQERWDDAERVLSRLLDRTGGDARLQLQLGNISWRRARDQRLLQAARN